MSADEKDTLYPLVINQLVYDGYGVFALSLKKILIPNCETTASNKLLQLVKLGLAVSKYLEDSDWNKDISQIVHAFRPNSQLDSPFFSSSSNSSNNHTINTTPQQNASRLEVAAFTSNSGVQPIKLEPSDASSLHFPFNTYPRPWAQQVINRSNINLDREIHELPNGGSPTKLFECSLCGKVFNRRDKVKRHLSELHHGIKSYQCCTCSRAFSRNDKLVRHIMTVHQDLKTHPCTSCSMKFSNNDKLAQHIMTVNEGIKAFGCSHCSRRFSRRWEYQRHMQLIHPDFAPLVPSKSETSTFSTSITSPHDHSAPRQTPTRSTTTPSSSCTSTSSTISSTPIASSAAAPIQTVPCVPNTVFPSFPMFNGCGITGVVNTSEGSFNMCQTVSAFPSIPFASHCNNAICPSRAISLPTNSPYASYMQPLLKVDVNSSQTHQTEIPNSFPKPFSGTAS